MTGAPSPRHVGGGVIDIPMQQSHHIQTSDLIGLHALSIGDAGKPAIVFSNSLGVTLDMWAPQIERLKSDFQLILYDTRGHGRSDAPAGAYSMSRLSLDVLEIMDAFQIERAGFCGLSLGGMTGQVLAVRAPERFDSFALAATSAYMGPPSAWQDRIVTVLNTGMAEIADAVLDRWFSLRGLAEPASKDRAKAWLSATNPVGYAGCCAAIRDMDLRATAGAIKARTLILGGEDDIATPPEHARFLKEAIGGAQLEMMPGGHLLNLEQPERFSQSIYDFFKSASGQKT